MQTKYHHHLKTAQVNYLLDSALVLAIHDFEDSGSANINKELSFKKQKIGYTINKIDYKKIYIKVFYKEKNKNIYREYLKKI